MLHARNWISGTVALAALLFVMPALGFTGQSAVGAVDTAVAVASGAAKTDAAPSASIEGVININEATEKQLAMLPGIGPSKARAIVMYRSQKPFKDPRHLVRVRGIVNPYRPYTVDGGTAEVTQARIGLHEERRPPELWIVVDLADPDVVIRGVDIRDGVAEIVLAGG